MITLAAAALLVQLHGLSAHLGSGYVEPRTGAATSYNALNLGLGLRAEFSPAIAIQAGAYRNSYRRVSTYVAADWTPVAVGAVRVGIFAGLVNRYPYINGGRFGPAGGLSVRYEAVTLRVVPPCGRTKGAVAVEVGWRL